MPTTLSEETTHLAGRIDQVLREYFAKRSSPATVAALDLMELFIKKGIFKGDSHRKFIGFIKL